jgi:uncharacterized protein (TIGR04255 family)
MSTPVPRPPYPKAPVTEGVIHLAVEGKAPSADLQKLVKRLTKDYPQQETLAGINVAIDTTGGATTVQQQTQGYRLKKADQTDIVVIFPDGVATARVAPYLGWEHLRERAQEAWAEWRRNITYSAMRRIGIRYINRIDVPIKQNEVLDLETYMNLLPRVPDFSKQPLSGFFVQITRPTDVPHWMVSATSNIVSPAPLIDHLSITLDIDVFRTKEIPGREPDLWDCVDAARSLKNQIFESCITDEARRLFA